MLFAAIPMNDRNRTRHSANWFSDFYKLQETRIKFIKTYCVLQYNNVGFIESETSKERYEHLRFRELHCHSAPPVYLYF